MLRPVFDQIKLLVGQKGAGSYCQKEWKWWHTKNLALHEHTVEGKEYAQEIVHCLLSERVTETDGEDRDGTTSA